MKLHSNYVLVRLTKKTDELAVAGITFEIETFFDEQRHQRIVGEIIQVPERLIYEDMNHGQMPWECEMEAMVGDETIIRRTDVSVARHEGMSYEEDGHLYVYVPYHALILVKRAVKENEFFHWEEGVNAVKVNDKWHHVIMLNGFMLIEQDDEDLGSNLTLPETVKETKAQTGTIRFIGKPNTAYHTQFNSTGDKISSNLTDDKFDLKVGDRVGFLKFAAIDLEMELHQTLAGKGKHFGRMQRNKILCKLGA